MMTGSYPSSVGNLVDQETLIGGLYWRCSCAASLQIVEAEMLMDFRKPRRGWNHSPGDCVLFRSTDHGACLPLHNDP